MTAASAASSATPTDAAGPPGRSRGTATPAPAGVFAALWDALADVLGTAATATLLRRALMGAATEPGLEGVFIARDDLTYVYRLPTAWSDAKSETGRDALRVLAGQLSPLLAELTGAVVLNRLRRLAAHERWGITFPEGSAT